MSRRAAPERLNRFLARRGVASRRGADVLIEAGRVRVNDRGAVVGTVVDPGRDRVTVDGRAVRTAPVGAITLALHKPAGVVTSVGDPEGRTTVMALVPRLPGLVPVGRLDIETRGLLLLTTDGVLAHRVSHPRYGVRKRYRAVLAEPARDDQLAALMEGVLLEDGVARALDARRRGKLGVEVTMGEGRKREVRRLCVAAGLTVVDLVRDSVGPIRLGGLREGASRQLSPQEDTELRVSVGLTVTKG